MKSHGIFAYLCMVLLLSSCSLNKLVINKVSDTLSGAGSSLVFMGDNDPELVGDAMPFAIKMYEILLEQNPTHQGLLLTTGSLFIMYANAFVQGPTEMLDPVYFYEERIMGLARAKLLYLRGYTILTSALEKKFPGFSDANVSDGTLNTLLQQCKKEDVPLLYWTVAGGLAAYSLDLFDFELGSKIMEWGAMFARAYELDPHFNNGAIDDFYILYYASLPDTMGGDKDKAEYHFRLALENSRGLSVGPYVSYAQAVCIPAQDYNAFRENLEKALAIDPNEEPSIRLLNIILQRRARHLLDTADNYFPITLINDWFDYE